MKKSTKRGFGYVFITAACVFIILGMIKEARASKNYTIEESTDYTGNGCEDNNVNTVTSSLRTALNNDGWSGYRWVNSNSWPQDLQESCSDAYGEGGLDGTYGDVRSLTVFAGHSDHAGLKFGYKRDGKCWTDFSPEMRLGTLDGSETAVAIYLGCDAMDVSTLPSHANHNWARQQLGFNNGISIGSNEPRDFYNATDGSTNADEWLSQMDGDDREPVAVAYGSSEANCWDVHDDASLADNVYTSDRSGGPSCGGGIPYFYYCGEWIDLPGED